MLRAITTASIVVILFACSSQARSASPSPASPRVSAGAQSALAYRPCRSADLALLVGPSGAYQAHQSQELSLVNRASNACSLAGVPAMVLYLDSGGYVPVAPGPFGKTDVDLAPRQTVMALIGTPATCSGVGHPQVGSRLRLVLPSGDPMSAEGTWVNVECGGPTVILFNLV